MSREGLTRRGVTLEFSDEVVDHVGRVGFSPRYGARPLQRVIEQEVVTPQIAIGFHAPAQLSDDFCALEETSQSRLVLPVGGSDRDE